MKRFFGLSFAAVLFAAVLGIVVTQSFPVIYYDAIATYCQRYDIDEYLVLSVIKAESNFDDKAKSHKNAVGLMQIMPDTARWCADQMDKAEFTSDMLLEPEHNIEIGVWYLSYLLDAYNGNKVLALAAYNAGIGNVQKWLGDPDLSADGKTLDEIPFAETKRYVEKISIYHKIYTTLYKDSALWIFRNNER